MHAFRSTCCQTGGRKNAEAKAYLTGAIEAAKDETIGQGSGPVRHFWFCGTQGR